jgi:hypothetical protein
MTDIHFSIFLWIKPYFTSTLQLTSLPQILGIYLNSS